MRRVLSIDWDFYFQTRFIHGLCGSCSWGGESPLCAGNRSWGQGGRPTVCEIEEDVDLSPFCQVVSNTPGIESATVRGARLCIAECHADLLALLCDEDLVFSFDAHVDDGDFLDPPEDGERFPLHCGNWATAAEKTRSATVIHEDDCWAFTEDAKTDRVKWDALTGGSIALVFLCQSCPWTPRWGDKWFYKAIVDLERATGSKPEFHGPHRRRLQRGYRRAVTRQTDVR